MFRIINPNDKDDGSGNDPAFSSDTTTGAPEVASPCETAIPEIDDGCGAGDYEHSLGVELQADIDEARREAYHSLGLRPYRVFLTWRRRNRKLPPNRPYQVIKRIELTPVNVVSLDGTDYELSSVGLDSVGGVTLTQISPSQVSESDLRGKLDGRDLVASEEEFFYEIVHRGYPGDPPPPRRRYIISSEPHRDGTGFMYVVNLTGQTGNVATDGFTDTNLPPVIPRKRPTLVS